MFEPNLPQPGNKLKQNQQIHQNLQKSPTIPRRFPFPNKSKIMAFTELKQLLTINVILNVFISFIILYC